MQAPPIRQHDDRIGFHALHHAYKVRSDPGSNSFFTRPALTARTSKITEVSREVCVMEGFVCWAFCNQILPKGCGWGAAMLQSCLLYTSPSPRDS